MMYRYYTTQREPMVGSIPRGAERIVFFDDRIFVDKIARRAWGYAEYKSKLSDDDISDYELCEVVIDD